MSLSAFSYSAEWFVFLELGDSLVEKFCGELKKQREQPFLPFSENIWSHSPAPYKSYTKEKKKKKNPHEDKGEKWLWYLIILYWSARVNCLKKEKLEKFSMFQRKRVLLFFMFFHVLYRRGRLVLSVVIASPLVLNFCTIGMVSWLFIIGWPPPLLERIKRCQNLTAADIDPSPSHHTPYTGTYIGRW